MKSNEDLQRDVQEAIKWQPQLNAVEIGVTVKEGVVSLTGIVNNYAKKEIAEKVAKNIAGVKAVVENIKVKINTWTDPSDDEIKKEITNAFKWHWEIPNETISVKVENGWVTLEGEVAWNYQKEATWLLVSKLIGVKGISDYIKILPVANSKIDKKDIQKALQRCATIDDEKINVEVLGHRVTLTGSVNSWQEREEAGKIAWNTPGVQQVDNQLLLK